MGYNEEKLKFKEVVIMVKKISIASGVVVGVAGITVLMTFIKKKRNLQE